MEKERLSIGGEEKTSLKKCKRREKRNVGKLPGRVFCCILCLALFFGMPVRAETLEVQAPSVILIEASTGGEIYEYHSTERRSPASITKIMTLLLAFEKLSEGKIHMEDQVVTSAYASSMGGSQVFLAEGETQTFETLLKCITVSSGNDASVAVAEHIAGSEGAFVELMNEKAAALGMEDTHFEDCCGLSNSDDHYTSARDVAIMSRELTVKYPEVFRFSGIWMEDIVHETRQGSSIFTLSSTNKLLKQYPWTTGLKTGSTSKAKFCLSATASKDGIDLIAVVMGAPDPKTRFQDAKILLNYGFGVSSLYVDQDQDREPLTDLTVKNGMEETVPLLYAGEFRYLDIRGKDLSQVEKRLKLPESLEAPVQEGEKAGSLVYYLEGRQIGETPVLIGASVAKATYLHVLWRTFLAFLL